MTFLVALLDLFHYVFIWFSGGLFCAALIRLQSDDSRFYVSMIASMFSMFMAAITVKFKNQVAEFMKEFNT